VIGFFLCAKGKSVNNLPPEMLPETADTAMSSRIFNLNPTYADEQDRIHIGTSYYLTQLTQKVLDFYGDGRDPNTRELLVATDPLTNKPVALDGATQLARANVALAEQSIRALVNVDIDIYAVKYKTKLGIRGLKDLLDRYMVRGNTRAHVSRAFVSTFHPTCVKITYRLLEQPGHPRWLVVTHR
jgi:hypothetical protein